MKKKILLALSLVAIMTVLFAISISAAEPVETWDISATEEDNVTAYLYNDLENEGYYTLEITGAGDMKDRIYLGVCWDLWSDYGSKIKFVTIENGVTSIGSNAFNGCRNLTNVAIGDNVANIGDDAFYGCQSLVSITIPESVTSIGEGAFYECTYLTVINFNAVEMADYIYNHYVFSYAGNGGDGITLNIGSNVTKIPSYLFSSYALKITNIVFKESSACKNIGDYAFSGCTNLTSVEMSNSVTNIGSFAFYNCASLTSVEMSNSVTSIGNDAFQDCTSLTSIELPNSVTNIGSYAFSNCTNLTSIELPNSVTSIGGSAFSGCTNLTSVTIPNSVTSIGNYAFYQCYTLTIYAEVSSQPSGWSSSWNYSNRPVVWDYKNTIKNDVFTFKGYSFGALGQISFGFDIDYEAKALYEELTGDTLEMGVVFAGYDNLGGNQPLDENGGAIKLDKGLVVKADLSNYTYSSYDFMLFDISDSISDIKLVIAAYMYDGEVVKYVQENGISDTVSGISYNEAKAK